ncbi:MAG: rRNA biogenesis protein [Candidatus Methanoperedenaceae archaeon]|nr:MAG: rRNA biogenesis protein [Candidatus Methanoperedenaceae archaeon]
MQIQTWFGMFTVENDTIISAEIFPKDLTSIIQRLLKERLMLRGSIAGRDLRDLAVEYGFTGSNDEYDSLLHELNIRLVKEQVTKTLTPDMKIIAAVEAIDDLDETSNVLSERLKEWYILNFENTRLSGEELTRKIIGMDDTGESSQLKIMQSFSSSLLASYETRDRIEEYLKDNMPIIAPNITNITGHILGARLLSIAGSLEKLAFMPSSTIQVIGANNALFKHLKGKAPSPKHGLIFRHPLINTSPGWQRGKIAKILSSKISLASRYDLYSGELKEELAGELKSKIDAIRKMKKKRKKIDKIRT